VPALSDIRDATWALADHRRKPTGTLRFSARSPGYSEMKVEIVTEGRLTS
jgi:hypothetical protein